jgi:hypothetical protein
MFNYVTSYVKPTKFGSPTQKEYMYMGPNCRCNDVIRNLFLLKTCSFKELKNIEVNIYLLIIV